MVHRLKALPLHIWPHFPAHNTGSLLSLGTVPNFRASLSSPQRNDGIHPFTKFLESLMSTEEQLIKTRIMVMYGKAIQENVTTGRAFSRPRYVQDPLHD